MGGDEESHKLSGPWQERDWFVIKKEEARVDTGAAKDEQIRSLIWREESGLGGDRKER